MKRTFLVIGALVALVAFLLPTSAISFGIEPTNAPRIHVTHGYSTNWSGYAVETDLSSPATGVVTDVSGSWIVPAVPAAKKGSSSYSAIWVGIDGYSSSTVEQIGTDQDIINGKPTYYAWYEMYPAYPVNLSASTFPIAAGDIINASVHYNGNNQFILKINNATKHLDFSTTQNTGSVQRSSAEWIMEAPSVGKNVLSLANFGTASIFNASATLNGVSGPISNWPNDKIDMVNKRNVLKAQTSALDTGGASFEVKWLRSN